jgi:hypothetical protein
MCVEVTQKGGNSTRFSAEVTQVVEDLHKSVGHLHRGV